MQETWRKLVHAIRFGLVVLAFVGGQHALGQQVDYGNNPQAGNYAEVNGIKLYYEEYGSGEPLLLLHGNGGSIDAFRFQIPFFEKHYHVIAVDSRLQGRSGGFADSLSYRQMADDFNGLLDYLKVDSAFVLGWSDGGINGILLAMNYPDKVKRLAVSGANVVPDSTALPVAVLREMQAVVDNPSSSPRDVTLNRMMVEQPQIPFRELKKIQCPVLVMAGDHDLIKTAHTVKIFESIPKASLCIFPDSHHGVCQQHPDLFNETVLQFFQK